MERRLALVRRPSPRLAEGLLTHLQRQPVDPVRAELQWTAYVEALRAAGWEVVEAPPAPDCPDSAFVEDTVVVYGDLAVISRPGALERRPEPEHVEPVLRDLGYRIARIEAPGTLDGGDVLKHGGTVWVGVGGRTSWAGFEQLAEHLRGLADDVIAVPVSLVLHLKSAVTALPDGTVVGLPDLVDDPGVYPSFLPVPEEHGGHVVLLGGGRLLMSTSAPDTAELYRGMGYEVVTVDIGEYEKLEGCVTCLSVRLRG
jgi:dimethylargininase